MKKCVMERLEEHYKELLNLNYEVVGLFLKGSQNYGLDTDSSDLDTIALVLPKFLDLVHDVKPVSTTHLLQNGEHLDIKDVRLMFKEFKKQGSAIEILFTEYMILNPKYESLFLSVISRGEDIGRYDTCRTLKMMCNISERAIPNLEKVTDSTKHLIDKFGYNPKILCLLLRIKYFMTSYLAGFSYAKCLVPANREYLLKVKEGVLSLNAAKVIALECSVYANYIYKMKFDCSKDDKNVCKFLDDTLCELMKAFLKEELLSDCTLD